MSDYGDEFRPVVLAAVSNETRFAEALRRVHLGYAWIKEHGHLHGLKAELIDPGHMDMGDHYNCALGQASGDRDYGLVVQSLVMNKVIPERRVHASTRRGSAWAVEHGFSTSRFAEAGYVINGILVTFPDLTEAWIQVITEDRETQ